MTHAIHPGTHLAHELPGYDTYDTEDLSKPEAQGFAIMNASVFEKGAAVAAHPSVKAAAAVCKRIRSSDPAIEITEEPKPEDAPMRGRRRPSGRGKPPTR